MSATQEVASCPDDEIEIPETPLSDPACWMGNELQQSIEWQYRLTPSDLAELNSASSRSGPVVLIS